MHTPSVQSLLHMQLGDQFDIDRRWFVFMLAFRCGLGFVLTAWGAPGMITKDFANHAVQLYLSRPLSRTEYLLGKASVLIALAFRHHMDTDSAAFPASWKPARERLAVEKFMAGKFNRREWVAVGGGNHALLHGIGCMGEVAHCRHGPDVRYVSSCSPGFGEALDAILRTHWGRLLNFPYIMGVIWSHLFRFNNAQMAWTEYDSDPSLVRLERFAGQCVLFPSGF